MKMLEANTIVLALFNTPGRYWVDYVDKFYKTADILEACEYELPEGYTLGLDVCGCPRIFYENYEVAIHSDAYGEHVSIPSLSFSYNPFIGLKKIRKVDGFDSKKWVEDTRC